LYLFICMSPVSHIKLCLPDRQGSCPFCH
jgi:hypothetical protein